MNVLRLPVEVSAFAYEPTPTTVSIDLDSGADVRFFRQQYQKLWLHWPALVHSHSLTRSKTRGHWHAVVRLNEPQSIEVRILLAAILGSDRVREMLNFLRWKAKHPMPILVFERVQK